MKLLVTAFLFAGLSFAQQSPTTTPASAPAKPATPPAPPPLVLSDNERLEQENLTLKLKLFQQELQAQYQAFQSSIKQYEEKVKAAHPGLQYQLNANSMTWEPIPAKPASAPVALPAKPEASKPEAPKTK